MRRVMIAGLLGLVALGLTPAHARTVTGTIQVPTAFTEAINGGIGCADFSNPFCYKKGTLSRHARCAYLLAEDQAQSGGTGVFGYVIRINIGDRGDNFTLRDTGGNPNVWDFDVVFYESLGTCEGETPAGGSAPVPIEDDPPHSHFGNESGKIPNSASWAIVTLFGAPNGTFEFKTS